MAEALLKAKIKAQRELKVNVRSAGLSVVYGSTITNDAKTVLNEFGLKTRHKPTQLNRKLINWADLILTMTSEHAETIISATDCRCVYSLGDYVGTNNVADPYNRGLYAYKQTFEQLNDYTDKLMEKLLYLKRIK